MSDDLAAARAARRKLQREVEVYQQEQADRTLPTGVVAEDFYAYAVEHDYIFVPTGQRWPSATINAVLGKINKLKASVWLDKNRRVEQITWAPGEEQIIKGKLVIDGTWIEKPGTQVFNLYRPPELPHTGNIAAARRWAEHVHKVYPNDAERIIQWCAQRLQHPEIKINHALVFGGAPLIGKDSLLEPVIQALGHYNCRTVSPSVTMERFNGWRKCLLLHVSEARDLGEVNRYSFYDHSKDIIVAPPNMVLIDEKNTKPYLIPNVCGVVITTNYKTGGLYFPADDRRHHFCWSNLTPADFPEGYWNELHRYYENGGYADIAAYLWSYDLADFDPKAAPPKTPAFWEVVNSNRPAEEVELSDALEKLGWPNAVTIERLSVVADPDFVVWLRDRKNRARMPRRFEECGYVAVRNPDAKDGLWRINGHKQVPYARAELSPRDQFQAVQQLG